jgi:Xaa-Pro aminopeptidase
VFPSYLLVRPAGDSYSAQLFISSKLLSPSSEAFKYVKEDLKVEVKAYESLWSYLTSGGWTSDPSAKLICGEKVSWAIVNSIGSPKTHILDQSPISFWKATKNDVEIEGMRRAYLRDGVCWVKWAAWLDERIREKGETIDEKMASDELTRIRTKAERYAGMESYDAISASGENAGDS